MLSCEPIGEVITSLDAQETISALLGLELSKETRQAILTSGGNNDALAIFGVLEDGPIRVGETEVSELEP